MSPATLPLPPSVPPATSIEDPSDPLTESLPALTVVLPCQLSSPVRNRVPSPRLVRLPVYTRALRACSRRVPIAKSDASMSLDPAGRPFVQPLATFVACHVAASAASSAWRAWMATSEMLFDHTSL